MDLGKLAEILQAAKDQDCFAGDVSTIEPPPPPPPFENSPEDADGKEDEEQQLSTFQKYRKAERRYSKAQKKWKDFS